MAALAVGFVPYRLRKSGTHTLPEVLPLGTYTWSIENDEVNTAA